MKKLIVLLASVAGFLAGSPAFAVAVDTTAAVAQIDTDGTAAVTAIGGAILTLAALSMVFRWLKGAIFG